MFNFGESPPSDFYERVQFSLLILKFSDLINCPLQVKELIVTVTDVTH